MLGNSIARLIAAVFLVAEAGVCGDWSAQLAARYLDSRQQEWFAWKRAEAAGGPCVSCHSNLFYLLARPALRRALGEISPTGWETGLLRGLRERAAGEKSKPTEAVIATLLLPDSAAQVARDRMWSLQLSQGAEKGAWEWFSHDLDPWEMPESSFFGAALAARAVGAAGPSEADRDRAAALAAYLRREIDGQPLHNRLLLVWGAAPWPEALPEAARRAIVDEAWRKQQPDGGWTLEDLGPWKAHEAAPTRPKGSDAYATAVAAFTLRQAGAAPAEPRLARALDWLRAHQDRQTGAWPASSMNKVYPPGSMESRFMQDAATALASLALLGAQ